MPTNVDLAREWLDVLAAGATDEWESLVSPRFSMHSPPMPGESDQPTEGLEPNRARVADLWRLWESFDFFDVDAYAAADDPDLVFVTARSEARTIWGADYRNQYVIRLRFLDRKLREHLELLDPQPVFQVFAGHLR